jgi:hypothetical protein
MESISKGQVSRLCSEMDKAQRDQLIISVAVLVAVCGNNDSQREPLAVTVGNSEAEALNTRDLSCGRAADTGPKQAFHRSCTTGSPA